MESRRLARLVAAGRIGFGLGLLAAPERLAGPWVGRDARRAGTQVTARGLGARDVALGAGALLARSEQELRPWLAGGILGDLGDLLATVGAGASLPRRGRILVGAVASGGAALGAIALAGLGRSATH